MNDELMIYTLLFIFAGLFSFFISLIAYKKLKNVPGVKSFIIASLLSALFSFFYAFELSSNSLQEIKLWIGVEYLVMPFIPVILFKMVFEYLRLKFKPWINYILFFIPCLTFFMVATNSLHHLYYSSVQLRSDVPFQIVDLQYGPFFYVHYLFSFFCFAICAFTLLSHLKRASSRFIFQMLVMVAGSIYPIILGYLLSNDFSPYGIDLGPLSLVGACGFHFIAFKTYNKFQVTPIFRDTIFETMKEGIIVINPNGIILDYNRAMLSIIPTLHSNVIGKSLNEVLLENEQLLTIFNNGRDCDYEKKHNQKKIYHQVHFSDVEDQKSAKIGQIVSFVNITEKIELQIKLRQLASIDGLTNIYNRSYFLEKAEAILKTFTKHGGHISLIMFDIDYFKSINDMYGHETGDNILCHVAKIAKESIRKTDIIGRYGGEEFIILLPNTTLEDAYDISNLIRMKISENITLVNSTKIHTTISLGVSHMYIKPNEREVSIQGIMRETDQALYAAKRNGRNNVQKFVNKIYS
ncbi:MAG TPA: diguanylate cyclase [Niallia sp.]|nr:diguanylate cyclase [Niallia sp.]